MIVSGKDHKLEKEKVKYKKYNNLFSLVAGKTFVTKHPSIPHDLKSEEVYN